ncbi:MAG: APC family permease [Lentisphaeria bacterium]|nr:APC family permease [Lentisphaeria bacterium]
MSDQHQANGKLGLFECVMLLIGSMVGSAIFSLSGLTMFLAGPSAVLSWLIAGAILFSYGMFMAEPACRFKKSGGVYYFPRMAFEGACGKWLGWLACWSTILTNIVAIAFSAIYVGVYLGVAFPKAGSLQIPLALVSVLACMVMNLMSMKLTGKINTVIVMALLAAIIVYVCRAFGSEAYSTAMLKPFFTQGIGGPLGFLKGIPIAIIGYSGIIALAFMAGEVRHARRTIPLSMMCAVVFVALIYVLMLLATSGLVSAEFLKENEGMRFIPVFAACFTKLSDSPWLSGVVSVAAVLALLTTMLVCVSINARAIQAAGEDGTLPACFGYANRRGIPALATIVTCLLAMFYACLPQYTEQLVNFGAVFNIIIMVITMLSLVKTRHDGAAKAPDEAEGERRFVVPGGICYPYVILLTLVACNCVGLFSNGSGFWLYTAIGLAVGVAIKLIRRK